MDIQSGEQISTYLGEVQRAEYIRLMMDTPTRIKLLEDNDAKVRASAALALGSLAQPKTQNITSEIMQQLAELLEATTLMSALALRPPLAHLLNPVPRISPQRSCNS